VDAGLKRLARETARDAIESCARDHAYHPVLDYLEALAWDGTPRLDNWLSRYVGADQTG
jgi:predicted P-loop ATPase